MTGNPSRAPHVIQKELRRRGVHLVQHRAQSLEQHLFNTFHILTAWRQPSRVRFAGLVHSVYSTDAFHHRTFGMDERDQVRMLVGAAPEQLAHLYCVIDRRELLLRVRTAAGTSTTEFTLHSRIDGHPVHITTTDAGDLLTIYMANAAEQCCGPDRSPASWLSSVSLLGRDTRRLAEVTPPIFDSCTTAVATADETRLIAEYARLVASGGSAGDSTGGPDRQCETTLADWPLVGEPLIWIGFDAVAHGRTHQAGMLGSAAAARLRQWGTPWDKRLALREWLQLCAALSDRTRVDELQFVARRNTTAEASPPSPERLYIELSRAGLLPNPQATPQTPAALPTRFQKYVAGLRTNHDKPRMTTYPGLRSTPWHDPRHFQLVHDLEARADDIAAEVHALAGSGFRDEAENIHRSGRWSVLFLYERGRKNEHNCTLCPQTTAVIEANRTVLTLGGLAYFSILEPGTHVAPHTGPTNIRLRCHLGIDVPEGCGLRVGGITGTWHEGRCIVFDDSFTHEVWNRSTRPRLILIIDLWHPDLTDDEVALLNGLHRYATATGTGLTRYWNRNRNSNGGKGNVEPAPATQLTKLPGQHT